MPKLNQINALVTGRKGEAEKVVGDIYKVLQKPELFTGRQRVYRPHDDVNGEKLPSETQKIQQRCDLLIEQAKAKWIELWDLTFTQDAANQQARANVEVDGQSVLKDVPVTSLLFLEKQVNDLETFVSKMPTPDSSEDWTHDANVGLLKSKPAESVRTRKEPSHYEKSPATKEHPAQVEFFHKDVPVGTWTSTMFSSAMPADRKSAIMARVKKLKDAIKLAREQANMIDATPIKAGDQVFAFVFGE